MFTLLRVPHIFTSLLPILSYPDTIILHESVAPAAGPTGSVNIDAHLAMPGAFADVTETTHLQSPSPDATDVPAKDSKLDSNNGVEGSLERELIEEVASETIRERSGALEDEPMTKAIERAEQLSEQAQSDVFLETDAYDLEARIHDVIAFKNQRRKKDIAIIREAFRPVLKRVTALEASRLQLQAQVDEMAAQRASDAVRIDHLESKLERALESIAALTAASLRGQNRHPKTAVVRNLFGSVKPAIGKTADSEEALWRSRRSKKPTLKRKAKVQLTKDNASESGEDESYESD